MKEFFKIDIHTHILPEKIPDFKKDFGYGGFIQLDHHQPDYAHMKLDTGQSFRTIYKNTWDLETRINEMHSSGIDVQVLSTIPVMFSYFAKPEHTLKVSQFLNDHLFDVTQTYPSKFIGLGTLPMNDPELALEEMDRCVKDLEFKGFEIGSHIENRDLSDPSFLPVFERAQNLNTSIFVHPWEMPWREKKYWTGWLVGMPAETTKAICDLIFSGVFSKYPKLRFAFAHGAGSFPGTIGRIEHGFKVRPDLFENKDDNPRNYLGHFWADTLTADPEVLKYNMSILGDNKIILGSDYPFPLGEIHSGKMVEEMSDLTIGQKEQILSLSALNWLDIRKDDYLV